MWMWCMQFSLKTECLHVCVMIVLVTNDLATSTAPSSSIDAKSVAEVNDIIENVFLVTLNKG